MIQLHAFFLYNSALSRTSSADCTLQAAPHTTRGTQLNAGRTKNNGAWHGVRYRGSRGFLDFPVFRENE